MAALNRATKANYVIHDHVEAETSDREDHTFCGIMFPVKCKDVLPIDHVVINSVSVRGALGPLTVWVSKDENINGEISMCKKHWKKIYQKTHGRSFRAYKELDLSSEPIVLKPGQVKGIYIHSTLRGDEAIVYDNKDKQKTHDDSFLTILPGRAHVSETPFGSRPIWGWGHAWRDNREFVGQIKYGAIYRLWNPTEHLCFGTKFRSLAKNLFLLQRRIESPFSTLPDDCIFYILNMCRWDWMNDTAGDMKECQRELRRARRRRLEREADDVLMEGVDGSADGGHVVGGDGDELWVHNHEGNGNAGGDDGDDLVDTESDEEDGDMEQDDDDDDDDDDDSDDSDEESEESEGYSWGDHVGTRETFVYNDFDSDDTDDEAAGQNQQQHHHHRLLHHRNFRAASIRARANILSLFRRSGDGGSMTGRHHNDFEFGF
mmetsp:Transcript_12061/g.23438  ORF Transcript_12061/g.23438 Transcript_12061/m.23438 type:complete len:432 (+) Transcript_12061:262-1557(+)